MPPHRLAPDELPRSGVPPPLNAGLGNGDLGQVLVRECASCCGESCGKWLPEAGGTLQWKHRL
jgi:hypothetical protein